MKHSDSFFSRWRKLPVVTYTNMRRKYPNSFYGCGKDHLSQLPPPRLLLRFPPQLDRRHGAPSTMKTNRIDLATATREQLVALCKRQRAEIQTLKEDLNYTRDDLISSRIAENRAGKFLSQFQDQLP
jgi:hypothetical protein